MAATKYPPVDSPTASEPACNATSPSARAVKTAASTSATPVANTTRSRRTRVRR